MQSLYDMYVMYVMYLGRFCCVTGPLCHWNPRQEGCIVYGLFMDGARWCNDKQVIQDSLPKARVAHQRPVKGEGNHSGDLSWFIVIYCDLDRFINDLSI